MAMNKFICPVCYTEYDEYPYQGICACGIQFGYEDSAGGDAGRRKRLYGIFRDAYVKNGNQRLSKEQITAAIQMSAKTS